jgi:hypothetical protein
MPWIALTDVPNVELVPDHMVASGGKLYAFTEQGSSGQILVHEYDPATDTWTAKTAGGGQRLRVEVEVDADGVIHVVGGADQPANTYSTAHYAYNPSTDAWSIKAALPVADEYFVWRASGRKLYKLGGSNETVTRIYDIDANTWSTGTAPPVAVGNLPSVTRSDGSIVIYGFDNGSGSFVRRRAYAPSTDAWSIETPDAPRFAPGAHVFAYGSDEYMAFGDDISGTTKNETNRLSGGSWSALVDGTAPSGSYGAVQDGDYTRIGATLYVARGNTGGIGVTYRQGLWKYALTLPGGWNMHAVYWPPDATYPVVTYYRLTESGDRRITESGDLRVLEDA